MSRENGVTNVSRENGVAKVGRETWVAKRGSRVWVANVGREWLSRNGVAKIKKFGGVCKWDPEGSYHLIKKCVRNK